MFCFTNEVVQEIEPRQFTFSINGKGFEVDPEPIPVSKLQSPSPAVNFDRFVEKVKEAVDDR
ncbi:hypothetical protein A3B51_01475 [Candidatus Curtissbacteria bacterium RIFCSPLOWO2_01_FULL_41_18]|uniref:Uncharacterized protein n=1 Tax=Candidatus Curtissbacteria bacterium RIFCSPLOWO2_01_FULL_41_18 TaxID=1797727 RepID=A0A1F5HI93_9BACT|nr:MAG: hypothetical protein A3B51_01475 [Candidatus Curtissbacteria bacterium RIFCSPLOWO2_01_FULL_41_18]